MIDINIDIKLIKKMYVTLIREKELSEEVMQVKFLISHLLFDF